MIQQNQNRIRTLRQRCLDRKIRLRMHAQTIVPAAEWIKTRPPGLSVQQAAGRRSKSVLSQFQFDVDELELLVGRPDPQREAELIDQYEQADQVCQAVRVGGQNGHCELDLSVAFERGLDGLRELISAKAQSADADRTETYESFIDAVDGLSSLIHNAAAAVERAMTDATASRREELTTMVETCRRIAHQPPQTFRDAIQLLRLVTHGVCIADQITMINPGRLDRTLWPFYQNDLQAGRLTRAEALELIECLYLLINETQVDGVAIAVMVGGEDHHGCDTTNDLSYLCLEAIRRTKLVYPTVGVCWNDQTPRELTDLAIDLIAEGFTTPAFFNDAVIQKGLADLGVPPEERCDYINSTCVEITPCGASNVWVASPYYNTCGLLLEEIDAVADQPPEQFEAFVEGYFSRLEGKLLEQVRLHEEIRHLRRQHGRKPLQSVFTRDCMERGLDIDAGGARYNWVECSFVGLANLADSLLVIRNEVFDSRSLTLRQLADVLRSDFAEAEALRQRFLHGYPKYGQGDETVDALLGQLVERCIALCKPYTFWPDQSPCVPGSFCWVMHEHLGRQTGTTPDGRRAGTPFADGGGPAQGRESKGPTAAIRSTTSWDHSPMIGGLAYNMKFDDSLFRTPEARQALRGLVETYLRRGGFETQINVVSRQTLLAAQADPEGYRDLVVRIGGYCDYFTRLSPEMQDEVLRRTEFESIS